MFFSRKLRTHQISPANMEPPPESPENSPINSPHISPVQTRKCRNQYCSGLTSHPYPVRHFGYGGIDLTSAMLKRIPSECCQWTVLAKAYALIDGKRVKHSMKATITCKYGDACYNLDTTHVATYHQFWI